VASGTDPACFATRGPGAYANDSMYVHGDNATRARKSVHDLCFSLILSIEITSGLCFPQLLRHSQENRPAPHPSTHGQ